MKRQWRRMILFGLCAAIVGAAGVAMSADPVKTNIKDKVAGGAIQSTLYDQVTIGGTNFEPANELVGLPEGIRVGDQMRVRYYTQNGTNYYMEIVRDGQAFSTEDAGTPGESSPSQPR